jgi:hypothetical protein
LEKGKLSRGFIPGTIHEIKAGYGNAVFEIIFEAEAAWYFWKGCPEDKGIA